MRASCTEADAAAIRDRMTRIEFARDSLNQAEALVAKVTAKRVELETSLIQNFAQFDPLSEEDLGDRALARAALQILTEWISNPPQLLRAVENLRLELAAAKPLIQALAQPRCVAECTISQALPFRRLAGLEMKLLSNQIHELRQIATEVLSHLGVLLAAKRGISLTPDEIRLNRVHRGSHLGWRELTFEERASGIANE